MTAPIWGLLPPETLSALLGEGPGDGSMMASAAAWTALGIEYRAAAAELAASLAIVSPGTWSGPTSGRYLAAHQPFLQWLERSAACADDTAQRVTDTATAYTTALAEMPTLAEIAANHAAHAALIGTNFLGVNTIPIAINEADYARMWVQAATVMATYDGVASTALASIPTPEQPPTILASRVVGADVPPLPPAPSGSTLDDIEARLAMLLRDVLGPLRDFFDGSGQWREWLRRLAAALAPLLAAVDSIYLTIQFFTTLTLNILSLFTPLLVLIVPLAFQLALAPPPPQPEAGLIAPADAPPAPARPPAPAAAPSLLPLTTSPPVSVASPAASATSVASAPPTPAISPAPVVYVIATPTPPPRQPPTATQRPPRRDDMQASAPATASTPTAAQASKRARRKRRAAASQGGERHEYADLTAAETTAPPQSTVETTGPGANPTRRPRGLEHLDGVDDSFSAPAGPLLPSDWKPPT